MALYKTLPALRQFSSSVRWGFNTLSALVEDIQKPLSKKNTHRSRSSNGCRADPFGCAYRVHECQKQRTDVRWGSAWLRTHLKYLGSTRRCCEAYGPIYNQRCKGEAFKNAFCSAEMLQPFKGTCGIAVTRPSCSTSTQQALSEAGVTGAPPHALKILSWYLENPAVSFTVLPPVYYSSCVISCYGML